MTDLQELLHDKPLKEEYYVKFLDNANALEDFVNSKDVSSMKQADAVYHLLRR